MTTTGNAQIAALNEAASGIALDETMPTDAKIEALTGIEAIVSALQAAADIPGLSLADLDIDGALALTVRTAVRHTIAARRAA